LAKIQLADAVATGTQFSTDLTLLLFLNITVLYLYHIGIFKRFGFQEFMDKYIIGAVSILAFILAGWLWMLSIGIRLYS